MPLSALSQSLQFHNSPESFISSRLSNLSISDPSKLPPISSGSSTATSSPETNPIRASILNRNVHIISSYDQCRFVLGCSSSDDTDDRGNDDEDVTAATKTEDGRTVFQAMPAYRELMAPFFPPPNLLLMDGEDHWDRKKVWLKQLNAIPGDLKGGECGDVIKDWILRLSGGEDGGGDEREDVDIYEELKKLAWDLLFCVFLPSLPPSPGSDTTLKARAEHERLKAEIEGLQETLLRGQFSLFPVSVRMPFWSSARRKGIEAREKLQSILREHFRQLVHDRDCQGADDNGRTRSKCPLFLKEAVTDTEDIANHVLLFTSSLANKALASLLLSCIMNVFLFHPEPNADEGNGQNNQSESREEQDIRTRDTGLTLAQLLRSLPQGSKERDEMVQSITLETERLSPPVVGILRRATDDINLSRSSTSPESDGYTIHKGHESWLYFPSASRDKSVFGDDAELFRWDRFMGQNRVDEEKVQQPSFAFGGGPKTCLGKDIVREMCALVIESLIDAGVEINIHGDNGPEPGVRAMLGWERAENIQVFARDLKQLPCQRPRKPVLVDIRRTR